MEICQGGSASDIISAALENNGAIGGHHIYPSDQGWDQQFDNPAVEGWRISLYEYLGRTLPDIAL